MQAKYILALPTSVSRAALSRVTHDKQSQRADKKLAH
jgi:hypothetical protein